MLRSTCSSIRPYAYTAVSSYRSVLLVQSRRAHFVYGPARGRHRRLPYASGLDCAGSATPRDYTLGTGLMATLSVGESCIQEKFSRCACNCPLRPRPLDSRSTSAHRSAVGFSRSGISAQTERRLPPPPTKLPAILSLPRPLHAASRFIQVKLAAPYPLAIRVGTAQDRGFAHGARRKPSRLPNTHYSDALPSIRRRVLSRVPGPQARLA